VLPIDGDGNVDLRLEDSEVLFPDGAIGTPGFDDTTIALEAVALFVGSEHHRVRLATGGVHQTVDDVRSRQNVGRGAIEPGVTVRDGELTDLTGTDSIFMMNQDRDLWYLSLQDEWSLAERWRLTAGVRYDRYSDFGATLNPRLALVWAARDDLFVKLLCGSAFRAPSFAEQFTINNPSLLGNPELDPEEIATVELAFDYRPRPGLRLALNLFTLEVDDLIDQLPTEDAAGRRADNAVAREGYGYEVELEWHPTDRFQLRGNFAWQQSEDEKDGQPVPDVPGRQLYLDALFRFAPDWSLDLRLNRIEDRVRAEGDPRPPIGDYTLVDLTLRRKRIRDFWDLAVGVRNLFDEDAREPSDGIIRDDYPLESRDVYVEVRYRF
jgi:iron complex outermembrane receptor protein